MPFSRDLAVGVYVWWARSAMVRCPGDIDLFHDEDLAYAQALSDAGVECTIDVVPGAPHDFEAIARDAAVTQAFHARARAWLGERLAASVDG